MFEITGGVRSKVGVGIRVCVGVRVGVRVCVGVRVGVEVGDRVGVYEAVHVGVFPIMNGISVLYTGPLCVDPPYRQIPWLGPPPAPDESSMTPVHASVTRSSKR